MLSPISAVLIALVLPLQLVQSRDPPKQKEAPRAEQQAATDLRHSEKTTAITPATSTSQRREETSSQSRARQGEPAKNWNLSDKIAVIATGVGFLQFLALIATVFVMKSSARRQLRAYISGPIQANIRNFNSDFPVIFLGLRNSGQTPAYDVAMWATAAVAAMPLENRPQAPTQHLPGNGASIGVVGPNGDFHLEIRPDDPVTEEERQGAIASTAAMFVYGGIFYRDSFGKRHTTTFCQFYAGERAKSANGILASYHQWNEAD